MWVGRRRRLFKLAAQVDWTRWSNQDELTVEFPASALPTQVYPEYWHDNWTVRGGGEFAVSSSVAVRAGAYYDTAAVPDRTIERQYLDIDKIGLSAGASLQVRPAGGSTPRSTVLIPGTRTVADNATDVMGFTPLVNKAPGDYTGIADHVRASCGAPFLDFGLD